MGRLKAMIVDDSSFSTTIIKMMLEKKGLEVVSEAKSIAELKEKILTIKPDLVTMDMTLTDGDGIEATKVVLENSQNTKVLAVSAMKDNEIIKKAREAGAKAYVQKPIDEEEFFSAIDRLFAGEELYKILSEHYFGAFKEAILGYLKILKGNSLIGKEESVDSIMVSKKSSGVSLSIGIIGRHCGRLILDMSGDTLKSLTKNALDKDDVSNEEMVAFFNEFGNIVGGNACSLINNINRGLGLRVSPPTVFHGKDLTISIGEIKSTSLELSTEYGDIFMNIGFQRGDDGWM